MFQTNDIYIFIDIKKTKNRNITLKVQELIVPIFGHFLVITEVVRCIEISFNVPTIDDNHKNNQ